MVHIEASKFPSSSKCIEDSYGIFILPGEYSNEDTFLGFYYLKKKRYVCTEFPMGEHDLYSTLARNVKKYVLSDVWQPVPPVTRGGTFENNM